MVAQRQQNSAVEGMRVALHHLVGQVEEGEHDHRRHQHQAEYAEFLRGQSVPKATHRRGPSS